MESVFESQFHNIFIVENLFISFCVFRLVVIYTMEIIIDRVCWWFNNQDDNNKVCDGVAKPEQQQQPQKKIMMV